MMRLTNADLAEIKKRAEAATEGNWHITLDDPYDRTFILGAFNGTVTVLADIIGDADATFIAHARQDVPTLLAEVERLRFSLESIVNIDGRYVDTEFDVEDAYKIIDEIAREALRNGE